MSYVEICPWAWPEWTQVEAPSVGEALADHPRPGQFLGGFRPLVGPLDPVVADVVGPPAVLRDAGRDLPVGAARAEGITARLRKEGAELVWGEPRPVRSLESLEQLSFDRGQSSVEIARGDPSVVPMMQLGAWFNAGWRSRALRRSLLRAPGRPPSPGSRSLDTGRMATAFTWRLRSDVAFWKGVRHQSTPLEWRRFTMSSYAVLAYHRLAGERRRGQEQLDLSPRRFGAQLRLLQLLRFHPLTVDEVARFHADPEAVLPRRSYLATFDDAFADNATPLRAQGRHHPVLFAPTAALGTTATWLDGEPILDWAGLRDLEESGTRIGSHSRNHARLPDLAVDALDDEVAGSRRDLAAHLRRPVPAIAYPNGLHDEKVVAAAATAGYDVGFTTEPGRNGAGTYPLCLRRVGVWRGDNRGFLLWKVLTGEVVPGQSRTAGRGWLPFV